MNEFRIVEHLHYIPQALLVTVLFVMSFLFIKDNQGRIKDRINDFFGQKWLVAFLFYTALLLTGTILSRQYTNPFTSITGTIWLISEGELVIAGLINILMFIPYTFLYLKAFKPKKPIVCCFCISLASTLFIELFQLLFWLGWFSIADIIHNILGGLIGCGLWYVQKRIINRVHGQKKHIKLNGSNKKLD